MKLTTLWGLPLALALGLSLAACDNNTPKAPATDTAAPAADATADAEKAAAEQKAAEEAAAAEKAAAEAKAAEEAAAAEKAAAEAKAAEEAAAAEKAAAEAKAAEEAAAAEKAAAEAKAAEEAAAAAKAEEEKKAAEAAAAAAEAEAAAPEQPAADAAMEAPAMEAAPTGVLPATGLKPDTILAAKADTSAIAYLGVWAPDAAACATVDQAGATGYVVITSLSVRQGSDMTIVDAVPLTDGKATLTAGDKTIELSMPAADQLQVGTGAPLVRCAAQ